MKDMLKRVVGTLTALVIAGAVIVGIVMVLAQRSHDENPLRDQVSVESETVQQDPWVLSEGERAEIINQLAHVTWTDETGELRTIDTSNLDGWTVREPLRYYQWTGSKLEQEPRWYYIVCYNNVAYVVLKAVAGSLPEGTAPVPAAEGCTWSWELIPEESHDVFPGWTAANMSYTMLQRENAVINTEDYGMFWTASGGIILWENMKHTGAQEFSSFYGYESILKNVVFANADNAYPLA